MKKILAPIDFSNNSDSSLTFAANLCIAINAEIHLLHSFDMLIEFNEAVDPTLIYQQYFDQSKSNFDKLIEDLHLKYPSLIVHSYFEAGSPIDAISNVCDEENIDLVIVGRTGASGLEAFLIGSTTTRIINHISTPIMVIPSYITFEYMRTGSIIVSTDLTTFPSNNDVEIINIIHDITNQKIHLINYQEEGVTISKENEINFLSFFPSVNRIEFVNEGTYLETIYSVSEKYEAKLLVLISKKKSFWQRFFEGHRTTRIANDTIYPLLILSEKK